MKQWSIGPGPAATLIAIGDPDNPIPTLIQNVDANNTVYLGETSATNPDNPLENVPLLPGQSSISAGVLNVFAIAARGQTVAVNTLRGFGSFFQPTNLTSLGGVAIYNTVTAPTQPPTIPLNSLWFSPAGAIEQWNGTSWTPVQFSGQQIIQANTIYAAQLAAGIVYAGIVNGTLIQGATIRVTNSFGATIMTINKSSGTWIQYLDTGSATQGIPVASSVNTQLTDEFGYLIPGGLCNYQLVSVGNYTITQIYQGNINFLNSTSLAGPYNIYASIEPNPGTGLLSYYDNPGNHYTLGVIGKYTTASQLINSTSPVVIGNVAGGVQLSWNVISGQIYHLQMLMQYTGGQAAGAPTIGFDGSSAQNEVNGAVVWYSATGTLAGENAISSVFANVNGPTLSTGIFNMTVDAWFNCTTSGVFNIRAQEANAGDTWTIKGAGATLEVVGG